MEAAPYVHESVWLFLSPSTDPAQSGLGTHGFLAAQDLGQGQGEQGNRCPGPQDRGSKAKHIHQKIGLRLAGTQYI